MRDLKPPSITITRHEINLDPNINVFYVSIEDSEGGSWLEICESRAELDIFLRGVKATLGTFGLFPADPQIPVEVTAVISQHHPVPD